MRSLEALKHEFRELGLKANRIAKDKSLPVAVVRERLDEIEGQMESVQNEMKGALSRADLIDMGGSREGRPMEPARPGEAVDSPSLALPENVVQVMYDAASSRKGLTLSHSDILNATITSGDVPPSTIPHYNPTPIRYPYEGLRIIDLVPKSATEAASEVFYRTTAGATAASVVVEGAPKPEANVTFEAVTAYVRKIATWVEVSDEALNDFRAFQSIVTAELGAGVVHEENHQLISGGGVAPAVLGILATPDVIPRPVSSDTKLDALQKAITDLRVGPSFTEPDGIVLHPNDFSDIVLAKDSQLRYLAGNPLTDSPRNLWGVPVVVTTDIPEGTGVVANFAEGTHAWIREPLRIEVNPWGEAQFKSNKVLILAEERLAFAVLKPKNVVVITGL